MTKIQIPASLGHDNPTRDSVFISYRVSDAGPMAGLLWQTLVSRLGPERVFLAPAHIEPGEEFSLRLMNALDRAAIVVAVIGKDWLSAKDEFHHRRLDDPDDWVRKEIAYGLEHDDVDVIPLLVQGASFPSVNDAAKAFPANLQPLANLHAYTTHDQHQIPEKFITLITQKMATVAAANRTPASEERDAALIVVVHCNANLSIGATSSHPVQPHLDPQHAEPQHADPQHASKSELLRQLRAHLPGQVAIHESTMDGSGPLEGEKMDLLMCQGAILLLDRISVNSVAFQREASILGWRAAMGMPLVTIPIDGMTHAEINHSQMEFLNDSVPNFCKLKSPPKSWDTIVANTREMLVKNLADRVFRVASDPATKWANDVTEILSKVSDPFLPVLAEQLKIPKSCWTEAVDKRRLLAASLIDTDLVSAYDFLREASAHLAERGSSLTNSKRLVKRAIPLWVDLDAGREILRSTLLPKGSRLCGVRLSQLEWASHATTRASAGAVRYPNVALEAVAGENAVDELIEKHDAVLREVLDYEQDDTPEFVESQLQQDHASVFAVLDSRSLTHPQLKRLINTLQTRFPGITFVLVSDQKNDNWRFRPSIKIAIGQMEKDQESSVRHYIKKCKKLATEEQ